MYKIHAIFTLVRLKVKRPYRHLQNDQNSSNLQIEVNYYPALAVGSAAQLASTCYVVS